MLSIRSFEHLASAAAIVLCACAFAATGIVLFGNVPPVFNQNLRLDLCINIGLLILLPILIGVLAASFFHSGAARLRRPILLLLTVTATLELLLFGFDKMFISIKGSALKGAVYSVSVNGGTIYLNQPNALSPFGFRWARAEPKIPGGSRILFLGDSYVEGSGTTFATNYPQAVEIVLHRLQPNSGVTVFSAGVSGYGPFEDRYLYDYLVRQGYRFDTVVLNFNLEGDETDDIRGTTRTAIVGRAQRLHKNLFLRDMYPLNSYLFRFMVYMKAAFDQNWGPGGPTVAADATCRQSPGFAAFSTERAIYNYSPGAQKRIDMEFNREAIDELAQDAQRNGARFAVVLLPDLNALLASNRERVRGTEMDWDWIRRNLSENAAGKYALLDLSESFRERPDLFECDDTHWNDKGNLAAAAVVADFLQKIQGGRQEKGEQTMNLRSSNDPPHAKARGEF